MSQRPRVGLYGGAFDPPHIAHRALAEAAISQLSLDRLHLVPTGQAWHKTRALTPSGHRLAMARLAFGDLHKVVVDDREVRRSGPSYTVDTLRELQRETPGAELFLVIGEDQADALTTWREWQSLPAIAIISIAARADLARAGGQNRSETWPWGQARWLQLPNMPVSATDIRQRLQAGQRVDHLVGAPVARYIDAHSLYLTA